MTCPAVGEDLSAALDDVLERKRAPRTPAQRVWIASRSSNRAGRRYRTCTSDVVASTPCWRSPGYPPSKRARYSIRAISNQTRYAAWWATACASVSAKRTVT